jgi:hypothetical protein
VLRSRYGTGRDNDDKLPARRPTGKQRIQKSVSGYVPDWSCNSSAELEALHILSGVTVNPVNVIGKKLASTLPQFTWGALVQKASGQVHIYLLSRLESLQSYKLQTIHFSNKYSDASVRPLTAPAGPTNVSSAHALLHHPRVSSHTNSNHLHIVILLLCSISGPPLPILCVREVWTITEQKVCGDFRHGVKHHMEHHELWWLQMWWSCTQLVVKLYTTCGGFVVIVWWSCGDFVVILW